LKAAVLGAQLTATVKEQLSLQGTATYFWADSEIVLSWINSPKTINLGLLELPPFKKHRWKGNDAMFHRKATLQT